MKSAIFVFIAMITFIITSVSFGSVKQLEDPCILAGDLMNNCADFCHVQLFEAPAPGQKRVLYANDIRTELEKRGYSIENLRLPKRITVMRKFRKVDSDELTRQVRERIEMNLPEGANLESMGNITGGKVPMGEFDVRITMETGSAYQRTVSVSVELHSQGVVFRTQHVLCRLSYTMNVPVAARNIARGEVIHPDAIEFKEMKIDSFGRNAIADIAQIVGLKSRTAMRSGDFFEARNLEQIPVVHRGDALTILSSLRGIRISARGFARQDAVKGERIAVEIPSLNKMLSARIVARGIGVVQQ